MYLLFFLLSSFLAAIKNRLNKRIIIFSLTVLLSLFAGTRGNIDRDHWLYEKTFSYAMKPFPVYIIKTPASEVCTYFIPNIVKLFIGNIDLIYIVNFSFLLFACIAVSLKVIACSKYSKSFFLSIFLYFGYLFFMQEMTTIRAGVASGLFMFMIPAYNDKKYGRLILLIIISFLFHYSSIIFVIVFLILQSKVRYMNLLIMLGIAIALAILQINILHYPFLEHLFPKINAYNTIQNKFGTEKINVFNFRSLFSSSVLIILLLYKKKFEGDNLFEILLKIHILSLTFFFLFSTGQMTFSARTYELLASSHLLLFPYLLFLFDKKWRFIPFLVLIGYGILQYWYLIDYVSILKNYTSWM